jgi:hypothetical protein
MILGAETDRTACTDVALAMDPNEPPGCAVAGRQPFNSPRFHFRPLKPNDLAFTGGR